MLGARHPGCIPAGREFPRGAAAPGRRACADPPIWPGACLDPASTPRPNPIAMTLSIDEDPDAAVRSRMKTQALARTCGWLQSQLARQDRILVLAGLLSASFTTAAWARHRALLRAAVHQQFEIEETVLHEAVGSMGLRAHVVVAGACRQRIRRELDLLEGLPWDEGDDVVQSLRRALESHFHQEQSCSYRQLARQQSDDANAVLTQRCIAASRKEAA